MIAPDFWYEDDVVSRLIAGALSPVSYFYRTGFRLQQDAAAPYRSRLPVICVGNLTVGGTGKTPVALALMDIIISKKIAAKPSFLTRGYGGRIVAPTLIDPVKHKAAEAGDEPLLLSRAAPTIISPDRAAGAKLAEANGMDLIVMDDGLQNPGLEKDLKLIVIDGTSGFGNRRMLPAGPLREPLADGLGKADAFVLIGEDRHNAAALLPAGKPLLRARLEVPASWSADKSKSYYAFSGIGRPAKFKASIAQQGLGLAGWRAFGDHHDYTRAELEQLDAAAADAGATLLTTEKDAARLPEGFAWKNPPVIMPVRIAWESLEAIEKLLKKRPLP
jgi:tetraacyldisaccharide 4'-kinase